MLYIIRGLPGSGKSSLGENLAPGRCFAADDYFMVDGRYHFNPSRLKEAHEACLANVGRSLETGATAVANTFSQVWEFAPYLTLSREVKIIDLFDRGLTDEQLSAVNLHGVPVEAIARMRARWNK